MLLLLFCSGAVAAATVRYSLLYAAAARCFMVLNAAADSCFCSLAVLLLLGCCCAVGSTAVAGTAAGVLVLQI